MLGIKLALIITYDGTRFDGWQDNLANSSIEGALKKALFDLFNQQFCLDAASRTDKGVHALNQVVVLTLTSHKIPVEKLLKALNSKLPQQIRIKTIFPVPFDFHPSLSVKKKTYLYRLDTKNIPLPFDKFTSWHTPLFRNLEAARHAALKLIGAHDFRAFTNTIEKQNVNPICTIQSIEIIQQENGFVSIEITADRFLYKMCRILVGTIVECGEDKMDPTKIDELLISKNRILAGVTAPSCGLFLKTLTYPSYDINI